MTVNSCPFLLFWLVFLNSVYSVQNSFSQSSSHPICTSPYTCVPTRECAERHAAEGIDQVLFQCEGKKNVCCPPVKFNSDVLIQEENATTEGIGCTKCSPEGNRPLTGEQPVRKETEYEGNPPGHIYSEYPSHVHVHPSSNKQSNTRRPSQSKPSESRRPPSSEPVEGRKPPRTVQNPQATRPSQTQNSQTSRPNIQDQQTPKPSQVPNLPTERPNPIPQRPSFAQNQQTPRPPQVPNQTNQNQTPPPPRPLNLQAGLQTLQSFTSHRNFRLLPSEANCGVNNFANRITEGEEVSLGEYPWMVLTGVKDRYGNYRWNCGGTLISEWYVLTAAHCLIVDNRTIEYVRLGEHSLANATDCYREVCLDPPEDIPISEVIPHERWNTTTIKNDIALLRLSRNALETGKSNIYPICLPFDSKKLNLTASTKYEVAGWGKTDWNADEGSDVLRKASISGVNREECNICKDNKKQQYCPIKETQLCVQGWKSVDVCKGDSGGPLMVTRLNIYQIGITSFKGSEYCGAENIPSIFTRVQSYLLWILDNIRE